MPITKRCIRCRQPLREDGTCQNPNCVRYVPEEENNDIQEDIEDKNEEDKNEDK